MPRRQCGRSHRTVAGTVLGRVCASLAPMSLERVCVYCGSSRGDDPAYVAAAEATGRALVDRDIDLIYGGGAVGLMGVIADAVLDAGGRVTGVIPGFLDAREIAHPGVTDLRIVESMHERKALMAELSDGFVGLPGGLGTFEELFEAMTWTQLGIHDKPVGLLDVDGYWAPVHALLDQAVAEGFLRDDVRGSLLAGQDPGALLDAFLTWQPPDRNKWIDLDPRSDRSVDRI